MQIASNSHDLVPKASKSCLCIGGHGGGHPFNAIILAVQQITTTMPTYRIGANNRPGVYFLERPLGEALIQILGGEAFNRGRLLYLRKKLL